MELPIFITILVVIFCQWAVIIYLLKSKEKQPEPPKDESTQNLLRRAYKRAQDIIASAELSGLKIRSQNKLESKKLAEALANSVAGASTKVEQVLYKSADRASAQFQNYLNNLSERSKQEESAMVEESRRQIAEYTAKFEADMARALEADVAEMRQGLVAYKTERLAAMDANFTDIASRTMEILLGKKINLKDQADLVAEALERAKQEKLIK